MPAPNILAIPFRWRRVVSRWLLLIWLVALLAVPYAMSLHPLSDSQAIIGILFGVLIVAEWKMLRAHNSSIRDTASGSQGKPALRQIRFILIFMVTISFLDIVYVIPYVDARVRELAGVAYRIPVQNALQRILSAIQSSRDHPITLAALLQSGAISPHDLRPLGMSVVPDPRGLENLQNAIAKHDAQAVSQMINSYSIFHYLPGGEILGRRAVPKSGGSELEPLILSTRLYDCQFGWVRLLGFSDGEVVEVVASPWAGTGSGPIRKRKNTKDSR